MDTLLRMRRFNQKSLTQGHLHAYETVCAAHQGLERYLTFYNQARPHRALDGQTPDAVYFDNLPTRRTAA